MIKKRKRERKEKTCLVVFATVTNKIARVANVSEMNWHAQLAEKKVIVKIHTMKFKNITQEVKGEGKRTRPSKHLRKPPEKKKIE